MKHALLRAALLATGSSMLVCLSTRTATQDPEQAARDAARATVETYTGRRQFLSAHRREDLEDVFYSVKTVQNGADPKIFEVSDEGYEFEKNHVTRHLSVHGPFMYLVAVQSGGTNVFRISGFKDSQSEFNRLPQVYQLNVATGLQADGYAAFYLQVDPLGYRITKISSLLLAKQLAERRFDESYGEFAAGEFRFDQWWSKNEDQLSQLSFPDRISPKDDGFAISFLTLSGIDKKSTKGPEPLTVTLIVAKDGRVSDPKLAPVQAENGARPN